MFVDRDHAVVFTPREGMKAIGCETRAAIFQLDVARIHVHIVYIPSACDILSMLPTNTRTHPKRSKALEESPSNTNKEFSDTNIVSKNNQTIHSNAR